MESAGLPLLSGPPPRPHNPARAEIGCRKCSKEFNVLFSRPRKCYHCGYSYCQSCTDYQALMPKESGDGYETMPVCGFCVEFLTVTASRKVNLKNLSLAKLRKYAAAYNINIQNAVEKSDVIDTLIAARGANGCLSAAHEHYYRTYSVPDRAAHTRPRGLFSRSSNAPPPPPQTRPPPQQPSRPEFARPDLAPDDLPPPVPPRPGNQPMGHAPPPTPPRPHPSVYETRSSYNRQYSSTPPRPSYDPQYTTTPPQPSFASHPNRNTPPPDPPRSSRPSRSTSNLREAANNSSRPRASSAAPTPPPRPPPTLEELILMEPEAIRLLSISALKSIMFTNHVPTGSGVLEKDDLVKKVVDLVEQEKRDRERHRLAEEQEEQERIEMQRRMMEEFERKKKESEKAKEEERVDVNENTGNPGEHSSTAASSSSSSPPPRPLQATERSGLCVVCQDEDANIAIVDCGHLAMCRACSELVMSSSRECPLCRTRIVTEARLLRIFKS